MSNEINPYAAPQTDPVPPPRQPRLPGTVRRVAAIGLAILLLIAAPIASVAALIDIESIVGSGPALAVTSLILVGLATRADLRVLLPIAWATFATCLGCFLTIFLLNWSPGQAQTPIGRVTVVFAVLIQLGWINLRKVWLQR